MAATQKRSTPHPNRGAVIFAYKICLLARPTLLTRKSGFPGGVGPLEPEGPAFRPALLIPYVVPGS